MLTQTSIMHRITALLFGVALAVWTGLAQADPPTRVARIGFIGGPVSLSPAGEEDWVEAALNRPLVTGDRLWADTGARVELQLGTTTLRVGQDTGMTLLNLDDRVAQIQLGQGTLSVSVRRLDPDEVVEIDTPNLAYVVREPGIYRISVTPDGSATEVRTRRGAAEVYGENASYVIAAGTAYRFYATGLRDYETMAFADDEFDQWGDARDRAYDQSRSARYVSPEVIGYQDLDAYGSWGADPEYGNVWTPTRVGTDWAPYRDGHWAWIEPWGWTWIDDAPWGFAVSHYGRWASSRGRWVWVPGPHTTRAVYAPALVGFVGGAGFDVSVSGGVVGWFPLGPRDVYRPAYPASRAYFNRVNLSNARVTEVYVTRFYDNRNVGSVTYVNQRVPGAVIAVPTTAFVRAEPVRRAVVRLPNDVVVRAPVLSVAAVTPGAVSVRGGGRPGASRPPTVAWSRPVFARTAPPPAPVNFAAREPMLARNPGRPVEPAQLANVRPPAAPAQTPRVEVMPPSRTAQPAPPRPGMAISVVAVDRRARRR